MPTPEVTPPDPAGIYALVSATLTGIFSYLGGLRTERKRHRSATEACEQRNRRLEQAMASMVAALEAIGQNNPAVLVRIAEAKAILNEDHD